MPLIFDWKEAIYLLSNADSQDYNRCTRLHPVSQALLWNWLETVNPLNI